jgi:hypothetical protein
MVASTISPPVERGSGRTSRVLGYNEKRGMKGRGRTGGGEERAPLDLISAAGSARAAPGSGDDKTTGEGEEQAVTHAISNACCLPTAGIITRVGGSPPLISFVNVVTDRALSHSGHLSGHRPARRHGRRHGRRNRSRSCRSFAPSIIRLLMFAPVKPFQP